MANGIGITSITLTDSGDLYAAAPVVTVSEPNAEYKLAALTPNLDSSGRLSSITIDSEGTFYDSSNLPSITFNSPDTPIDGSLQSIFLSTNPIGSGYVGDSVDVPTTRGSGVGIGATVDTTVNGSGQVTGVVINNPGKGYALGDINRVNGRAGVDDATFAVTAITSRAATIPTVAATIVRGRLTAINITDSGDWYDSASPVITQTGGRADRSNFNAQITSAHDADTQKISSLSITDSGDFYLTAPTITIAEPFASVDFIKGEQINQDRLSDSSEVTAEVASFNKPDQSLQVINIGNTENGSFKEFVAGQYVTGATSGARAKIKTRSNVWDSGDQNTIFATEIEDFLDFSESNPFGEPNRSGEI